MYRGASNKLNEKYSVERVERLKRKYGEDPNKIAFSQYDIDNNTERLQAYELACDIAMGKWQDEQLAAYYEQQQQEQSYDPYICKACSWPAPDGSGVCDSCARGGIY